MFIYDIPEGLVNINEACMNTFPFSKIFKISNYYISETSICFQCSLPSLKAKISL